MTHISIEYIILFFLFNAFKIEFYFLGCQHCNHCENESKEALSFFSFYQGYFCLSFYTWHFCSTAIGRFLTIITIYKLIWRIIGVCFIIKGGNNLDILLITIIPIFDLISVISCNIFWCYAFLFYHISHIFFALTFSGFW